MIWTDDAHSDNASRLRIADRLLDQIPALCEKPALAESSTLTEAAMGVAAFLNEQGGSADALDSRVSSALVSRALEAAGDSALARRVRLFGDALVHSATWVTAGNETVWVLDVGRLMFSADPCIEIALFDRLRVTLATFADVWDGSSGRGVLGLKGLARAAAHVLGPSAPPAGLKRLAHELHEFSGIQLDLLRVARGWQHTPAVMSLL
jgi:hypothetical protein